MREKTKDAISDVVLEEIEEAGDVRYEIKKIIREEIQFLIGEIKGIREEIGRFDKHFEMQGRDYLYFFPSSVYLPVCERLKKLEDITKANDYGYKTETKLVKKTSLMTATEAIKNNKKK